MWEHLAFTPSVIEVEAGTEVTWVFTSDVEHNVICADGPDSPPRERGATWSRAFDEPGRLPVRLHAARGHGRRVVVMAADTG